MSEAIESGKNCFNCIGHCCTFEHNSMRVTPIEALDAFTYLEQNNRINKELVKDLEDCIKQYRLDKEILIGKGQELRRYYTCPFYKKDKLGCTIGKHHKPYGCLAFNPLENNVTTPGHCKSDQDILEQNAEQFKAEEKNLNTQLKEKYQIYWDKKDLPSAVLFLIKKLTND